MRRAESSRADCSAGESAGAARPPSYTRDDESSMRGGGAKGDAWTGGEAHRVEGTSLWEPNRDGWNDRHVVCRPPGRLPVRVPGLDGERDREQRRWQGARRKADGVTRSARIEDVLGPLAAAIVHEVMGRGEASLADVVGGLQRTLGREHANTTIMTVISRLHEKGVLARERRGRH